jgi:hypothetical protein
MSDGSIKSNIKNIDNSSKNNLSNTIWLSNDNFKMVKVLSSTKNFLEFSEAGTIKKVKSDDFESNYNEIDLDTKLYNGIPTSYLGNDPVWF